MACVVNIRGRVYEGGPLPLWTIRRRYQVVRWMPEAGFTRADLYCSGPHVGTTIFQRKKFPVLPKGKTYSQCRGSSPRCGVDALAPSLWRHGRRRPRALRLSPPAGYQSVHSSQWGSTQTPAHRPGTGGRVAPHCQAEAVAQSLLNWEWPGQVEEIVVIVPPLPHCVG